MKNFFKNFHFSFVPIELTISPVSGIFSFGIFLANGTALFQGTLFTDKKYKVESFLLTLFFVDCLVFCNPNEDKYEWEDR